MLQRLVAVGMIAIAVTGCGPTCSADDATCFLEHLDVKIGTADAGLVDIPAGKTTAAQYDTSATQSAFFASNAGDFRLDFKGATDQVGILVDFTDPYGARPGGCFAVHKVGQPLPGVIGTYPMRAFHSATDGQTSGHIDLFLETGVDPHSDTLDYAIDLFPISTPGADALADLLAGGTVKLGQPVSILVTIGGQSASAGNTDGVWSGTCTTTSQAFPQPSTTSVAFTFSGGRLSAGGMGLTGSISGSTMTLTSTDSCSVSFNATGGIASGSVNVSGDNANDPSCAAQSLSCSLTQG